MLPNRNRQHEIIIVRSSVIRIYANHSDNAIIQKIVKVWIAYARLSLSAHFPWVACGLIYIADFIRHVVNLYQAF
jgi:hypothetical protein